MSIKLLSASWDLDIGSTEKMVLMCLCDYANDEGGNCWPSVATIARKTSKGARTVQGAIKWLADQGYLTTTDAPGKSHSFQLNPRKICAPAENAPPQKKTITPAKSAPNPPRTVINGLSDDKPIRAFTRKDWPKLPDWLPAEPWNGFIEMRRRNGNMPTARAVGLMIGKLERWRAQGHDPGEILDNSTVSNWRGLFEPKDDHGQHPPRTGIQQTSRGPNPDPLVDMLAAARAARAAEDSADHPGTGDGTRSALPAIISG